MLKDKFLRRVVLLSIAAILILPLHVAVTRILSDIVVMGIGLGLLILIMLVSVRAGKIMESQAYAEKALKESEEKYRSLVESTDDYISLLDKKAGYLFMNEKYLSRQGLPRGGYAGRTYDDFHAQEDTVEFHEKMLTVLGEGRPLQYEHKSGRDGRYFLRTLSPVMGADGKAVALNVISKDITERKQMEEELRALSLRDDLTGLYNRRGFFTLSEHLFKMACRSKKGIYMVYADFDKLKIINDTLGHKEGDRALVEIGEILKKSFRSADIVARIGGDEFVVIPVGVEGDDKEIITSRLQGAIDLQNAASDRAYKLSLSMGIAYYDPACPCSPDELLAQADRLMYEQKNLKKS